MLALTILQPYPYAIRHWGKPEENRMWRPENYGLKPGDRFAIHAGKLGPKSPAKVHAEVQLAIVSMFAAGLIKEGELPTDEKLWGESSAIVSVVTLDRVIEHGDGIR